MYENKQTPHFSMSLRGLLLITGIYTAIWGAFFRWFGPAFLQWLAMSSPAYPEISSSIYGSLGLISGLLVFASAFYPISGVYLMVGGMIGKTISSFWFLFGYMDLIGWNKRSIFHLTFNELVWLIPLAIIIYKAFEVKKYLRNTQKK